MRRHRLEPPQRLDHQSEGRRSLGSRSARLRRELPRGLIVHRRDYPEEDVTRIDGLPTTTLFRTLVDLIVNRKELQFVDEP